MKQYFMKRDIMGLLVAVSSLCVMACHSSSRQHANNDTLKSNTDSVITIAPVDTSIEGHWYLQPQLPSDTSAGRIPQITFTVTENKFFGNTGCNSMTGMFVKKGDSLRFDERMVSTRMLCTGYNEKAFIDNLLRTNRFEIKNGVLLLLENQTVLSKWVRKLEDQPVKKA